VCGRRATLGGAAEYGTRAAVTTSTDTRDTRQYAVIVGEDAGAAPAIGGTVGQPGEPWNPTGCELSMRSPEVLLPTMIGRRGAQGGGGLKISSGRNRPLSVHDMRGAILPAERVWKLSAQMNVELMVG
jgi:hypothetical protein